MKKTIVVPVDFSAASVNAANYAADFARAIQASVTLLHVWNFPAISQDLIQAETINQLIDNAEKNIRELKENLEHKTSHLLNIYTEIREGNTVAQLKEFCDLAKPVMVIMGGHQPGAGARILFGSNTLLAMRNLQWPLIVLPLGTRFNGIKRIGLACDLQNEDLSVHAAEIQFLFNEFHPEVHVLHVTTKKHGMLNENEANASASLKSLLKGTNPIFHFIQHPDIETSITAFSEKNNLQLLIVVPKKRDLLASLVHKSHSKEIVLAAHIPVMSIHE